ncbi:hypothetical protein B0H13DRAFT_2061480, partial [Mycena leptocephala]
MPVPTSRSLRNMRSENEDETRALLPSWPRAPRVPPLPGSRPTHPLSRPSYPYTSPRTSIHPPPSPVPCITFCRVDPGIVCHRTRTTRSPQSRMGQSSAWRVLTGVAYPSQSIARAWVGLINPLAQVHSPFPMACTEGDDPRGEGATPGPEHPRCG